jgi:RNA-directed DNA polymerase
MSKPGTDKKSNQVTVPFGAIPAGETPRIAEWAHPMVWTERMLNALQSGVRGGKWHALIDKVYEPRNLFYAGLRVVYKKGAPGIDQQTVEDFGEQEREELERLHELLRKDHYQPVAVRRAWIPKPGSSEKRPLGIPTVRDRVVQTALVHVIEPILDKTFHDHSYGFRHGRSAHDALRRVEELLDAGYVYVVDADLKSYFDTIPKDRLLNLVRQQISDSRVLRLIKMYLDQGIMEDLQTWTPITGVPQGAVLSPVLANLYLNPLDHLMSGRGSEMIRYADDFVILCRTMEDARSALAEVQQWVTQNGLTLHPEKTQIVDYRETSFEFLGYAFRGRFRFPRAKSHAKLVTRVRDLTSRQSGESLEYTIQRLNSLLRGWFTYFRHCFWTVYEEYDQLIRRRLRRLLIKRHRLNPQRLPRTHRWPNAYFTDKGLFSLAAAHARLVQSRVANNQPESRMRENRPYGSEGGGA